MRHLDVFATGDEGHAVRLVSDRGAGGPDVGAAHMGGHRGAVFRGRQAADEHGIRDRHLRDARHFGRRTVRERRVSMTVMVKKKFFTHVSKSIIDTKTVYSVKIL